MRVGLYARVSTGDQQTLPAQIDAMRGFAESRGWKIKVVVDEVVSSVADRRQREKIMQMARRRDLDAILVWKLDRWGRSVTDLISTLNELQDLGVAFVSLTESLDFTTASGRLLAGLLAIFAAFERDLIKERTKAGLALARRKGKILGRPKTALKKAQKAKDLFANNISKVQIAKKLGIHRRSVDRILAS